MSVVAASFVPSPLISSLVAPDETIQQWDNDLRLGMQLQPDHFSIYGLTYEKGTNFWSRRRHGSLHEVDEELQRAMHQLAIDELVARAWNHYEISNFARPAHRCRHNEVYWSGGSYFAAGPGARPAI